MTHPHGERIAAYVKGTTITFVLSPEYADAALARGCAQEERRNQRSVYVK